MIICRSHAFVSVLLAILAGAMFTWAGQVEIPVTLAPQQQTENLVISWKENEGKKIENLCTYFILYINLFIYTDTTVFRCMNVFILVKRWISLFILLIKLN
jgi:hypothetical protein